MGGRRAASTATLVDAGTYPVRRPDEEVIAVSGPSRRETATAYHEAGHAVIGFWGGVPTRLLTVSIVPDPQNNSLGHVSRGKHRRVRDIDLGPAMKPQVVYREFDATFDDQRLVERRLRPEILECFAGVLAERRFTGRHNWVGAHSDLETAGHFIDYITGSARQAQKYSDYLWVVAEDAVAVHWPGIHELAQELLVRKTMTGLETKAFLQAGTAEQRREIERLTKSILVSDRRE